MLSTSNMLGLTALGTAIAIGGLSSAVGGVVYYRRAGKEVENPPALPFEIAPPNRVFHAEFGAWKWGLVGLGATALFWGLIYGGAA